MDPLYIGLTLLGAIVWGVRQEGRINLNEAKITSMRELIEEKFEALAERSSVLASNLDKRLERIERALNGYSLASKKDGLD